MVAGTHLLGCSRYMRSYYVDGEASPSVSLPFGLAHGLVGNPDGMPRWPPSKGRQPKARAAYDSDAPFSAGSAFGKTGDPSGVFNHFRVPFSLSIRVTVRLSYPGTNRFWLVLRGTSAAKLRLGGFDLPPNARLRAYVNNMQPVRANALVPLMWTPATRDGAVYLTVLTVANYSRSDVYQEGCIRAHDPPDGRPHGVYADSAAARSCVRSPVRYLVSSGTEDYFLGTW